MEPNTMESERLKDMVTNLRTAYLALVRACGDCDMANATDRKSLFRLKEEVCEVFLKKYALYRTLHVNSQKTEDP